MEADKPYHLRVVLGIADQRLLTDVFKEQVERELRDGLRAALGDLATVEVVRTHPRLKEVEANGLQTLDAWKDADGVKTHFILIDYVNGRYEIRARQHDGYTGLCSPVVRTERLPDPGGREFVARAATLLVGQDFGMVGTVSGKGDNQIVQITLKGSALGVALDRWVQKGDVFALVQISRAAGGYRAVQVPWAVLQAQQDPANGVLTCQLFHRHPDPLATGAGVLGYRCLKLTTIQAPLRLRLVLANAKRPTPVPNQQLYARRRGFTGEETSLVQGVTDPDGYFTTEKDREQGTYDRVAFVTVMDGDKVKLRFPVALVDDRPVVVSVSPSADSNTTLAARRDLWVSGVYESLLVTASLFKDVEDLLKNRKRQEALDRAQAFAHSLPADIARDQQERQKLVDDAKGAKLDLSEGDQRLQELVAAQGKLNDLVGRLQQLISKENDPKVQELKAKVQQAQLAEGEAEYGKALDLYEQVLKDGVDDPALKAHYDKLKAAWAIKSDQHRQARDYIYNTWPEVEPLKLKAELPKAREAFETCKAVGDYLTPQKLLRAVLVHAAHLKEQLARLQTDINEDDRKDAKDIEEITTGLNALVRDVNAYVDQAAPADK